MPDAFLGKNEDLWLGTDTSAVSVSGRLGSIGKTSETQIQNLELLGLSDVRRQPLSTSVRFVLGGVLDLNDDSDLWDFLNSWDTDKNTTRRVFSARRANSFLAQALTGNQFAQNQTVPCRYGDFLLTDFGISAEFDGLVQINCTLDSDNYGIGEAVQWWGKPNTAFTATETDSFPTPRADRAVWVLSGASDFTWNANKGYYLWAGPNQGQSQVKGTAGLVHLDNPPSKPTISQSNDQRDPKTGAGSTTVQYGYVGWVNNPVLGD